MDNIITKKKINELKENFRIPLYQREYAWSVDEVSQLIDDLETFTKKTKDKEYFLGNIVVTKNGDFLDVIDGQQRLTTLYLMLKAIGEKNFSLKYEIRKEDEDFLEKGDFLTPTNTFKEVVEYLKNQKEIERLIKNIVITLTIIPRDIDVVKYFEVMNNRGKQLEKHQILKAKFLKALEKKDYNYAKIWDYCSLMDTTIEELIYYNDIPTKNKKKEKTHFQIRETLLQKFSYDKAFKGNFSNNLKTINTLLSENENNVKYENNSIKEYRAIIKFPIFLIQVLKIFIANKLPKENQKKFQNLNNIVVNDRYLLDYFHTDKMHNDFLFDDENLAKDFMLFLLKMRILFDYFIFKRDKEEKPFFIGRENKNLLMIELLFNVSAPQYFSQDWIVLLLNYLDNENKIDFNIDNTLVTYLEKIDNELSKIRLSETKIIEYINDKLKNININIQLEKELDVILSKGVSTPHYWFYKLDYLLWKNYDFKQKFKSSFSNLNYSKITNSFRLSRLNSIEHIYPQSKANSFEQDTCKMDNFGNLALISNHMNSALIDKDYQNKRLKIQEQINNKTIESLKMILVYSKYENWNEKNCQEHQKEMIKILTSSLI